MTAHLVLEYALAEDHPDLLRGAHAGIGIRAGSSRLPGKGDVPGSSRVAGRQQVTR